MKRRAFLQIIVSVAPTIYLAPWRLFTGSRLQCCVCGRQVPEEEVLVESTGHRFCLDCMEKGQWEPEACRKDYHSGVHRDSPPAPVVKEKVVPEPSTYRRGRPESPYSAYLVEVEKEQEESGKGFWAWLSRHLSNGA